MELTPHVSSLTGLRRSSSTWIDMEISAFPSPPSKGFRTDNGEERLNVKLLGVSGSVQPSSVKKKRARGCGYIKREIKNNESRESSSGYSRRG